MYYIYSIYTDELCAVGVIFDESPCMLLAICCMYFYLVKVPTIGFEVYTECMQISTVLGFNVDNAQCL